MAAEDGIEYRGKIQAMGEGTRSIFLSRRTQAKACNFVHGPNDDAGFKIGGKDSIRLPLNSGTLRRMKGTCREIEDCRNPRGGKK